MWWYVYKLELAITYIVLEVAVDTEQQRVKVVKENMEFVKKLLCCLKFIRIFIIHVCLTRFLDLFIFGPIEVAIGRIFEEEAEAGGVGGGGRGGRGVAGDRGETGLTG